MPFHSILSHRPQRERDAVAKEAPPFLRDLDLDQMVTAMTTGRREFDLEVFFFAPLHDVDTIYYRHAVMRDLEHEETLLAIRRFSDQMRSLRGRLAQADLLRYAEHQQGWFLTAVQSYCAAVRELAAQLNHLEVRSDGFLGLREHLNAYVGSERFVVLETETAELVDGLAQVTYGLHINEGRVRVSRYDESPDYSAVVQQTFAKFKHSDAQDHRGEIPPPVEMDHVEAQILAFVARLFPEVFSSLRGFCARHRDFQDAALVTFDREVQFYVAYLGLIAPMKAAGLGFCYPEVSTTSKGVGAVGAFDLALARKLVVEQGHPVVRNDFFLTGAERLLVVTGPNQGGKTTFARTFGQLHYLASLGLPVAAAQAQLFLPDQLYTHFERQENLASLRGKLEDELTRFRTILEQATRNSIIIINEGFTSTTSQDAQFLGEQILRRVMALGMLGVCVTFVDELTALGPETVSMASTVVPDDPAQRTYQVVRKPADGLAYAAAIAKKHGVDYPSLKARIAS